MSRNGSGDDVAVEVLTISQEDVGSTPTLPTNTRVA
jgi:hypothetical protein